MEEVKDRVTCVAGKHRGFAGYKHTFPVVYTPEQPHQPSYMQIS